MICCTKPFYVVEIFYKCLVEKSVYCNEVFFKSNVHSWSTHPVWNRTIFFSALLNFPQYWLYINFTSSNERTIKLLIVRTALSWLPSFWNKVVFLIAILNNTNVFVAVSNRLSITWSKPWTISESFLFLSDPFWEWISQFILDTFDLNEILLVRSFE